MVEYRCYCCGQSTDRPIIFTAAIQRVFNYVWDNPGCSTQEISDYIQAVPGNNHVQVHLTAVRRGLAGTDYRLKATPHPDPLSFGPKVRRMMTYKITEVHPHRGYTTSEGIPNGTA